MRRDLLGGSLRTERVLSDLLGIVPPWVLLGTAIGLAASAVVALVFVVGTRISPPEPNPGSAGQATGAGGSRSAGDVRRHREIRAYLTAIGERFDENHGIDGVTVPFYLPERGVAITFDAHDYFQLESEGVFTVLCEHEMPGRGLGRRLPFDVREPNWRETGTTGAGSSGRSFRSRDEFQTRRSVAEAFDVLGLSPKADSDEVKGAYRERVKRVHPDQGGDEESFRELQAAYATARDHAEGNTQRPEPAAGFGR